MILKIGDSLSDISEQLKKRGYESISQVFTHSEFALHGTILDIFAMGNRVPFRLVIENGVLKSIRAFDVESQRAFSTDEIVQSLTILPAHEFPFDEHEKATLFDYLPKNSLFVSLPNLENAILDFDTIIKNRFDLRKKTHLRLKNYFYHRKIWPLNLINANKLS